MRRLNFLDIILVSAGIVLFILAVMFIIDMKTTPDRKIVVSGDSEIVVSGQVECKEYRNGNQINVFWHAQLPPGQPRNKVVLRGPGRYDLSVPKNAGEVYITSSCYVPGIEKPFALVTAGPINIGTKNINLNLILEHIGPIMKDYKGPTVKLSGKIVKEDYREGIIRIMVKTESNLHKLGVPSDIVHKNLSGIGNYAIEVPKGIGAVYLFAVYIPSSDPAARSNIPGAIKGEYSGNPLNVGSSDIDNVDIYIK